MGVKKWEGTETINAQLRELADEVRRARNELMDLIHESPDDHRLPRADRAPRTSGRPKPGRRTQGRGG